MNVIKRPIVAFCLAFLALLTVIDHRCVAQVGPEATPRVVDPVTFAKLVHELGDRNALARLPDPPYELEIAKHGDSGSDSQSGERTVAEFEGPGALVRIWSANPTGVIRIYFDGEKDAVVEAPASDLLSGTWRVSPPFADSIGVTSVLTLPMPFAKHCRVTCDADAQFGVSARRYNASVPVTTFSIDDLETHQDEIAAAARMLGGELPTGPIALYEAELDITKGSRIPIRPLDPGQEPEKFFPARQIEAVEYNLPEGGHALSKVTVKLYKYHPQERRSESLSRSEFEHALRNVNIMFQFDKRVSSRAPIGDFMGVGVEPMPFSDPMRSVDADGTMTSYWVMPYEKSCVVALHNLSQELDIWAELKIEVSPWTWDERSLYFAMHSALGLETEPNEKWLSATTTATHGRMVGQSITVMNPVSTWWGGIDETVTLGNGEILARLNEADLFGVSAETATPVSSPFVSRPRRQTENGLAHLGHTSFNRLMLLDAVNFSSGLNVAVHAPENLDGLPDFSSLVFVYTTSDIQFPTGYAGFLEVLRSLTWPPAPLDVANPIEGEDLTIETSRDGFTAHRRKLVPRAGGSWSGEADLFVDANRLGDGVTFEIPAEDDEEKSLAIYLSGGDQAGAIAISVNGTRVIDEFDLWSRPDTAHFGPIALGTIAPINGAFTIRVGTVAMGGKTATRRSFDPESRRYAFGIDCITINTPEPNDP